MKNFENQKLALTQGVCCTGD